MLRFILRRSWPGSRVSGLMLSAFPSSVYQWQPTLRKVCGPACVEGQEGSSKEGVSEGIRQDGGREVLHMEVTHNADRTGCSQDEHAEFAFTLRSKSDSDN